VVAKEIVKKPNVLVCVPFTDWIHPDLQKLCKGDFTYDNYHVLLRKDPKGNCDRSDVQKFYRRCSEAREDLRQRALCDEETDYLLMLDSDVVPEPDVIEKLLAVAEQGHEAVGGWIPFPDKTIYKNRQDENTTVKNYYCAGMFLEDESFAHYEFVRDYKTTYTHLAPLGCCLIKRDLLERTEFRSGCEENQTAKEHHSGQVIRWGECMDYAKQCWDQDSPVVLAPDAICRHEQKL